MEYVYLFLEMTATRDRATKRLWLTPRGYVEKLARWFNLVRELSRIPIKTDVRLEKESYESTTSCEKPYRKLVGLSMFIACSTRPNVMFAIGYLARYLSCHGAEHGRKHDEC